jgi:hypothetical protein
MDDDRDLIRVDLLKFRRKAYLSYPPDSVERKNFLRRVLQNELLFTKMDVPHDLINFIIEGDKTVFNNSIKNFFIRLGWSILSFSAFALIYRILHTNLAFIMFGVGVGYFIVGLQYLNDYWIYRKSVKTIKKYSNDMQQYINRISNDIKRLEGPK